MNTIKYILIVTLFSIFYSGGANAQKKCKVLDPNLQGTYEGKCKNGFAHGKGKAVGIDTYEGLFNKGMKDKKGIYMFADGGVYNGEFFNDQMHGKGSMQSGEGILKGYWKNGKYLGEDKSLFDGYKIIQATNFQNKPVFRKMGEGQNITINIKDIKRSVTGFRINRFTSGTIGDIVYPNGGVNAEIMNVNFPFEATISYKVPNKSGNFDVNITLQFEIFEDGNWRISADHN